MSNYSFNINPALKPLWDNLQDKKKLYGALASVGMNAIEKNFSTEGERVGNKWNDLKPATIKARTKKSLWPGKILQARGNAAKSIQANASDEAAVWGTNVKYIKTHVLGLTINYPERSAVVNFRKITRGFGKGRIQFAKENKAIFAQKILHGARSYTFPVRNPFQFNQDDFDAMNNQLTKLLT
jgi:phage virion morphogenesis protein